MKFNVSILSAAVLVAAAMPANAEQMPNLNPYVGVDFQHMNFDYNDNYDIGGGAALDGNIILEDSLNGGNIHVGVRPHQNFGAEIGYFRTEEADKGTASGATVGPGTVSGGAFTTNVRVQGITLDALGYLPVTNQVELIGTAGVLWSKADMEIVVPGVGTASQDESEIDFRVGAGAQYQITQNVNLRGLVRYQTADFEDVADHVWTYTAGVNYSF